MLISFEVLAISAALEQQLFEALAAGLGSDFSKTKTVLAATHTHSAPPTSPLEGESEADATYWQMLAERTVQAAQQAVQSLQSASLSAAAYRIPGHTINRRALMTDGAVSMALEPDGFVLERGPVDDTLSVLLFRDAQERAIAAVLHFACHGAAVCTDRIGGDIPGVLARRISQLFDAPCLYLQGAAGDTSPLTVSAGREEMLAWIQPFMARMDSLPGKLYPLSGVPLRMAAADLPLNYQPLPSREGTLRTIENFDRIAQGDVDSPDVQDTIRLLGNLMNIKPGQRPDAHKAAYASMALANAERRVLAAIDAGNPPEPCRTTVAVLRIGQIGLACVSAELFASTGFRIRALSRDIALLPVTYTAPIAGYVPDRDAMEKGGYEVDDAWRFYRHPAPFALDRRTGLSKWSDHWSVKCRREENMNHLAIHGGERVRAAPWPQWPIFDAEDEQLLLDVLHSGNWWRHSYGEGVELAEDETDPKSMVARFQRGFARAHACKYGVCAANGTVTMEIGLRAMGIKPGDEVIVPTYTYVATATAVLMVGAIPIFVDIDPDTYNMDPACLEAAITARTAAVIPVHFGGQPCDMDAINALARQHNLKVLEDAAHAHGSSYKGQKCGSLAEMGSFSFQLSKNMTAGEGGIITTNDLDYAETCEMLVWAGRKKGHPWYQHFVLASNARMTEFQGALLLGQLRRLPEQNARRTVNARRLDEQSKSN